jgi:hypothetical protein
MGYWWESQNEPTAAARVRSREWLSGICGEQSGAGASFLRALRFPLPIFIPPIGGKARMKETTGSPRRRWMDNIKMDLREIG